MKAPKDLPPAVFDISPASIQWFLASLVEVDEKKARSPWLRLVFLLWLFDFADHCPTIEEIQTRLEALIKQDRGAFADYESLVREHLHCLVKSAMYQEFLQVLELYLKIRPEEAKKIEIPLIPDALPPTIQTKVNQLLGLERLRPARNLRGNAYAAREDW